MSSFMVSEETVCRFLTDLYWKHYQIPWISSRLEEAGFSLENSKEMNRLGDALLRMNREAVNQRYSENESVKEAFHFDDVLVSPSQALKSLRCFLYQCSEGSVPNTELYKVMRSIADFLAMHIIEEMPQYQNAEWG